MVLGSAGDVSISELVTKGEVIGAYARGTGWSHDGLVRLAKEYGVEAFRRERMSMREIQDLLDHRNVVIASIKWAFEPVRSLREKLFFWKKRGGHLALVIGYDSEGFYVHHTSTLLEYNWEDKLIPWPVFRAGFTGRGIVLKL